MKNALLILLLLILPWQAITAAERNFAHVIGSGQGEARFVKHFTEHAEQVLHHHDDADGDSHEDDTQESSRHLADVDHGFSLNVLLPAAHAIASLPSSGSAPVIRPKTFSNRTTVPPLRPPRALA